MEIIAKIAVIIFVAMVVTMLIVQIVTKRRVTNKNFAERKKAFSRMTDEWFKSYYKGCQRKDWKGISARERRTIEAELKRRRLTI